MKKILLALGITILAVLLLAVGVIAWGNFYASNYEYDAPEQIEIEPNKLGTITAVGDGLYDATGKRFDIKGVNFGNLFIAEGWMTVNSVGALKNEDGSYQKYNPNGVVE